MRRQNPPPRSVGVQRGSSSSLYPTIYMLATVLFLLCNASFLFVTRVATPDYALLAQYRALAYLAIIHNCALLVILIRIVWWALVGREYEKRFGGWLSIVGAVISMGQPIIAFWVTNAVDRQWIELLFAHVNLGIVGTLVFIVLGHRCFARRGG